MKRILLAVILAATSISAETISMVSEGKQGSGPAPGRTIVRLSSADNIKSCLLLVASDSPLAARGAIATVAISTNQNGSWTVTERILLNGVIRARLNDRNAQGSCLLSTADEITYPLGSTFDVSVR